MSYSKYELNSKINYLTSKLTPIIPSPTPGELVVVDTIIVADKYPAPNQTTTITPTDIVLDDGVNTNTLSAADWTGNIRTVNTVANLTHYLNFSDSSATGYGHPQKTAGISCNPSTNSITATSFIGSASSSTSAVGVDLTSDDTVGTYYIPFSKTTTATGNALFIDNTPTPLTYNPNTSTLTCSIFNGSANTAEITDTNTNATFYPVFVSAAGSGQTLRADIATNPLVYNPSTGIFFCVTLASTDTQFGTNTAAISSFSGGTLSLTGSNFTFRNFGWVVTGAANTMSALSLSTVRVNGVYNVTIINNGTGNLTLNTGLGLNTLTKYTGPVVVLPGNLAVMTIQILSVNSITRIIVDAYNVA